MLGFNSVNQTLQGIAVKEKIRNYLTRFSLANSQLFAFLSGILVSAEPNNSFMNGFIEYIFEGFLAELSDMDFNEGKDLKYRYAVSAIYINTPDYDFQGSDAPTAYKKGLSELKDLFGVLFSEFMVKFNEELLSSKSSEPSSTQQLIPPELKNKGFAVDEIMTFLSALSVSNYMRMVPTTYPKSYPLYSATGPLWNQQDPGPYVVAGAGQAGGEKSLRGYNKNVLYAGPPNYSTRQPESPANNINQWPGSFVPKSFQKLGNTESITTFYLEHFFRIKKSALYKLAIRKLAAERGAAYVGTYDWPTMKPDISPTWYLNPWSGFAYIPKAILDLSFIMKTFSGKGGPSDGGQFLFEQGAPYVGVDKYMNDIKLFSQYLSYDEVLQLIELSKGPKIKGSAVDPASTAAGTQYELNLDDFDVGIRLMLNVAPSFAAGSKSSAGLGGPDNAGDALRTAGESILKLPYHDVLPALNANIMNKIINNLETIMKAHNDSNGHKAKTFFSPGDVTGDPQYIAFEGNINDFPYEEINKIITTYVNPYLQKVSSAKSFLQYEIDNGDGKVPANANKAPNPVTYAWGQKPGTLLASLPIAEFMSSDLDKVFDSETTATAQKIFSQLIPALFGNFNFIYGNQTTTIDNAFNNILFPWLLIGLSRTANVQYFLKDKMNIDSLLNLFPIYTVAKSDALGLPAIFMSENSPFEKHTKMLDQVLNNIITFNER